MASLELRRETYRVVFMHAGRKYGYSLDTRDLTTAEALRGGVEKTLMLIQQRAIQVPENVDIVDFVRAGGRVEDTVPRKTRITLAEFRKRYLETHANGSMEANSLATVRIHLGHFAGSLGERFHMQDLTLGQLQDHVNRRSRKMYRGKKLSPATLRKEVATLRAAWNWAALMGLVSGTFPSKGLVYPKTDEKPPFMTMAEIERRIAPGMNAAAIADLWQSLYFRKHEIDEFLEFVRVRAAHGWIHPMLCTAAHTGARRSELLRILISDVDLEAGTILIREKKRSRKERTTHRAPITPQLADALKKWIAEHPGGPVLFCQKAEVARSSSRSPTTGHRSAKYATTTEERSGKVRKRGNVPISPVTKDECHDHFKRTVAGSKWEVVKGFHVLRHSFISCLASSGVDQRVIDDIVGHQTDEQRKRYRHLYPNVVQDAVIRAFRAPTA